ncbi:hypothetical protein AMAG_05006 [Allomyces macrogynus ATCC 38327]|uniref:Uncharacterized protein n=1 Tax=Allomyces macrogynus (strain ATCC 38327) TaxID=578462 RepID=A0A0L0S6G3_ALLM3|nr:hypothetical protein AMAG_05006 [Allomyces macrogynus ATCC 38327]|eukprot:KNE58193.1 hypothetical protein AMAG_05006 [Allomyces macrogynus ATCC 38327]
MHLGLVDSDQEIVLHENAIHLWFDNQIAVFKPWHEPLDQALELNRHAIALKLPMAIVKILDAFPDLIAVLGFVVAPKLMELLWLWSAACALVCAILADLPRASRIEMCIVILERQLHRNCFRRDLQNPPVPATSWDPIVCLIVDTLLSLAMLIVLTRIPLTSRLMRITTKARDVESTLTNLNRSPWWPSVSNAVLEHYLRVPVAMRLEPGIDAYKAVVNDRGNVDETGWTQLLTATLMGADLCSDVLNENEYTLWGDLLPKIQTAAHLVDKYVGL